VTGSTGPAGATGPTGATGSPLGTYLVGTSSGGDFATEWATITPGSTITIWTLPGGSLLDGEQAAVSARIEVQAVFPPQAITGATNGTPPIVLTVPSDITTLLANGSLVRVSGGGGNTAMNGGWPCVPIDPTHVALTGSIGNGAYTSGGILQAGDFGHFTRDIEVRNNAGHISTPLNTTIDTDLTQPVPTNNVGPSLATCAAAIVISAGTVVIQSAAPANVGMRVKISAGAWSRGPQQAGAGPGPSGITLGISGGSTSGGTAGPTSPGYTVPISGSGLIGVQSVSFNGVPASFVWNSNSSLTATPGAGSAGSGVCTVVTSNGSASSAPNTWTYYNPPTFSLPLVRIGKYEGGDTIVGPGTNLTGCTATVGGVAVTGLVIGGGGTTYSFTLPASAGSVNGGFADVVFTNATQLTCAKQTGTSGLGYLFSGAFLIFEPTQGTTPSAPTDGADVSAFASVDGVGNWSTSQSTANNQPVYKASTVCNGMPAIRTSKAGGPGGVPQYFPLASGVVPSPSAMTQWGFIIIGALGSEGNNAGGFLLLRPAAGGAPAVELFDGYVFGGPTVSSVINTTSGASTLAGAPMTLATPHVVSIRHDGTTAKVRLDGVDGTAFSDTTSFTFGEFSIGCADSTAPGQWDNCLTLGFNRCPTTADFTAFSAITNAIWGAASA
jgi:hypothetical protein